MTPLSPLTLLHQRAPVARSGLSGFYGLEFSNLKPLVSEPDVVLYSSGSYYPFRKDEVFLKEWFAHADSQTYSEPRRRCG